MKYYLAYGSNLDLNHMKLMCSDSKFLGITKIDGFKLAFRGEDNRSYLTAINEKDSFVYAGIFEITDKCGFSLDHYEDYPNLYYKEVINFQINDNIYAWLIYIMHEKDLYNKPSEEYLEMVKNSYKFHNLDINLIEKTLLNK